MSDEATPYAPEELELLRTGANYRTRQNARWFATLASLTKAAAERDAVAMMLSAKLFWTVASELMAGNAKRAAEAIIERLEAAEAARDAKHQLAATEATMRARVEADLRDALAERDKARAQVEAVKRDCEETIGRPHEAMQARSFAAQILMLLRDG